MGQTEFDSTTTPFDAGLGHFVQMDKPDFIGKSALEMLTSDPAPSACVCQRDC